jgi:hypothetical protein
MNKKVYDVANVLYLYEKYKTITDTAMRSGYGKGTIKKILVENGVELKKYIPPRWNINQGSNSKLLNLNMKEIN